MTLGNVYLTEKQQIYQQAYADARAVVLEDIKLELEGLQVILEHCKDERASLCLSKRLDRLKSILSMD